MGTPSLFLNLKNKHKYGYSNVSANLNIGKRIYSKTMASFLSQAVVHAALDGIKENNFESFPIFLSLDQIFYALHVKDNIVSFYDKEHS